MKVLFERLPADGKQPRLTVGTHYLVVGFGDEYVRVLNDAREPILYPWEYFSDHIGDMPNDWIRRDYADGEFHVDPAECAHIGFYEDYFDGLEEAQQAFQRALARIQATAPEQ